VILRFACPGEEVVERLLSLTRFLLASPLLSRLSLEFLLTPSCLFDATRFFRTPIFCFGDFR